MGDIVLSQSEKHISDPASGGFKIITATAFGGFVGVFTGLSIGFWNIDAVLKGRKWSTNKAILYSASRMGLLMGGAAGTYQTVTGIARDMFLKDRNSTAAPAFGGLASGVFLGMALNKPNVAIFCGTLFMAGAALTQYFDGITGSYATKLRNRELYAKEQGKEIIAALTEARKPEIEARRKREQEVLKAL
eukprot:TRINITY_DN9751_c0_g1_i1.p1 TRINITY_DN9751_c0_g1~~TRINITY_DN9751_c0_g1_i1.p1  ORF type:complete len:190 (-),score=56.51 TRINITY_DN9751_c0_g1_i1:94-663(-)